MSASNRADLPRVDPALARRREGPRGVGRGAVPLANAKPEPELEGESAVEACKAAARDCAFVMMGFAHIAPDALFKSKRGVAEEAFPRQVMMALLVSELGFSSLTVGRAIGRDKATVEHACRIVQALRDGIDADHLIDILGASGVQEYLGGFDGAEHFLAAADALIDDFGVAFRLVAIKGGAYRRDVERRKTAIQNSARSETDA